MGSARDVVVVVQKGDHSLGYYDFHTGEELARVPVDPFPVGTLPTIEHLVQGESFAGGWHFVIPEQRGRLHVEWQHGRRTTPEDQEVIVLTFTARGRIAGNGNPTRGILEGLDLGHEAIVKSFAAFSSKAANEYWGLKNASD